MKRVATLLALSLACAASSPRIARAGGRVVIYADRDDDDANGVPDGDQARVPRGPELYAVPRPGAGAPVGVTVRGDAARVLADGVPVASGGAIPDPAARVEIEGVHAGRAEVDVFGRPLSFGVVEVHALDGDGRDVSFARSHASLQRTPPDRLGDDPFASNGDPDALRFVVMGLYDDLPSTLSLISIAADGSPMDALVSVPLGDVPCPASAPPGMICGSTRPIRAVVDDIDRSHPLVADRSIKAELGGAIAVASPRMEKAQMIRVAGPRQSPAGPIERFRAAVRVFLVRMVPHGPPPMGGDDAGAVALSRGEIDRANAMWGACGISLGPAREAAIAVVDPPRPHLLALGCDHGLPASGGAVRARVDGREVMVKLAAGMLPAAAARVVAAAIDRAGFRATVSDNPAIGAGAFGTTDVLVRRRGGEPALVEPPRQGPVSSDATMTACIGRVDLEAGLAHFGDVDAAVGTVEERALIKAFDDGDPATIEVFVVPSFRGGGRIGESFIASDGGAVQNLLVEDRGAIRSERAAFALAHELGHILLDDPGHPDDFGADTPTRLMDADAANGSAYGPRRLVVAECARALRQSGPGARIALLKPWPLAPLLPR